MKKLPLGISTLKDIITEDYLYVDKSDMALDLINRGRYYFLSRPRRFGKSLFLDTLRSIFEGKKELFKGLYIYDKWDWETTYPVIRISFSDGEFQTKEGFMQTLYQILEKNQRDLGIESPQEFSMSGCFKRVIEEAYLKYNQKVVVLIDEYDKPILDNIEKSQIAKERREELKNFYSVIKGSDEFVKFVFITGVSKFSKVSLFSGLNNLNDITIDRSYATICGYTQNDIETTFALYLEGQDFEKIAKWYNGYKWLGEGVYNPFDILLFIQKGFEYRSYWFTTATPTFLLRLIAKNNYFLPNLENVIKNDIMLDSFDVDYIEIETLMWQTGYLTIDKMETNFDDTPLYRLTIPNQEVKIALFGSIVDFMSKTHESAKYKSYIYHALYANDIQALQTHLTALYASIPYNLFTSNKMYEYEGYYVSIFYAYIKSLGLELIAEDTTNKGRIDITLMMPNAVYIMEFKSDGSSAMEQIKAKAYHQKYLSTTQPIYLLGIEFNRNERNISKIEWEKV